MSPSGSLHGRVTAKIHLQLGAFTEQHGLGETFIGEAGFLIGRDPDIVRVPDIAFVSRGNLPGTDATGFFQGAPDLAIEVISPSDRMTQFLDKAEQFLEAGSREVWLVDPQRKRASVCSLDDGHLRIADVDVLSSEDLLPGFALTVAGLWPSE